MIFGVLAGGSTVFLDGLCKQQETEIVGCQTEKVFHLVQEKIQLLSSLRDSENFGFVGKWTPKCAK